MDERTVHGLENSEQNLTTEARRYGEDQEIQMISNLDLTSSNSPLRFFMSLVVSAFSVSMIFVSTNFGNLALPAIPGGSE
jgi:hypothetical protein